MIYSWCVIGAGPAGIAAVGKLIDFGVSENDILWIDPSFSVGDLGSKWYNVSSNTKVDLFIRFLKECSSFSYGDAQEQFTINELPPHETCLLGEVATPLQWITNHLIEKVTPLKDKVLSLHQGKDGWVITGKKEEQQASKVILATGAEPRHLSYPELEVIPLHVALNPEKLKEAVQPEDTIAVFGASHSGVLILENLLNANPKEVYNFYRSSHLYAVDMGKWILFDNTGLKGRAAVWAKENLDGIPPQKLHRCHVEKGEFEDQLARCNKVVYAVGFTPRQVPTIEPYPNPKYQETTGIIAPGLFGCGIAYPQAYIDPFGNKEHRVGLWKFMDYLNTVVPLWLKY